ncbi:MAG: hypothetical protein MUO77_12175 [Anaerolineales bacterium]|nr:hypothetical protein [Anaerolineales bacterium]
MNKILKSIIFTGLLLSGITSACSSPAISASQDSETPTLIVSSATPVTTPTESGPPASATPEFALFCELGNANVSPPAQCQIPIAEESSAFCVKKKPYNLIFINAGATYQVLTRGFWCSDAGMKDGRQMVTCIGPMAADFQISVCDPACAVPTVQVEITQCPQGYNYDNFQGCCTREIQQVNQNCVTLKLKTTSCVVDCGVYRKKSICNKNYIACEWNSETRKCETRK